MKIVCDACSAKYSIADDKVKGKVFKIRCKKCSNIIVVRGTAGAGAAEEPPAPQYDNKDTRVYDYGYDEGAAGAAPAAGDDAVWHLVIDQEQVGPLTVAEVQQRFAQGQIDSESYVWREGFGDWQPLATVDVFEHLAAGGGAGAAAVASMFGSGGDEGGTQRSNPDDLFAAAGRGAADDGADDAGDLFGARAAAAPMAAAGGDDDYDKPVSRGGQAAAGGGKLRGERNENSVLFSLGNLAALASDAPRAAPASSSSSSASASGTAQHGGGEGSGLIDIRSMASAYLGPQGAQKKQQSNIGSIDDLPVFSAAAFSEPAVIMPGPVGGRQNNKTMVILMAAVAALAVITLVLVLVVVLGDDKGGDAKQPAVAANEDDDDKGKEGDDKGSAAEGKTPDDPAEPVAKDGTDGAGAATGGTDGTGPGTAAEAPKPDEDKKPAEGDKKPEAKKPDRRDDRKDDRKEPKKEDKEDKPAAPSGNCPDEVGCLLSEKPPACCSKYSKGGKKKPAGDTKKASGGGGGDLPESIDSDMVKGGVAKVKSKIFSCGDKYPAAKGTLKLSVKVSASGSVSGVSVVSSPDAGLGKCAASAMKGASFPKTQRGGSFKYPFNF